MDLGGSGTGNRKQWLRLSPGVVDALEQVRSFMRQHRLSDDDLVNYGGKELSSLNRRIRDRAHWVEECWELMARLGVKAKDLARQREGSG